MNEKRCLLRFCPGIAFWVLIAGTLLSACSVSGNGLGEQLALAAAQEVADPALPDEVLAVPTLIGERRETVVAVDSYAYTAMAPSLSAAAENTPARLNMAHGPRLDGLIAKYADYHQIPEKLLRRVVKRESTFNAAARNGSYWGLMQILPQTARTMGYQGTPEGLLDAETNLMYAGKYLRGAYITAQGDHDLAVRYYSRGYYYDAKRKGLLEETGLKPRRKGAL